LVNLENHKVKRSAGPCGSLGTVLRGLTPPLGTSFQYFATADPGCNKIKKSEIRSKKVVKRVVASLNEQVTRCVFIVNRPVFLHPGPRLKWVSKRASEKIAAAGKMVGERVIAKSVQNLVIGGEWRRVASRTSCPLASPPTEEWHACS